jgi:Domain of Unknown Function with PDB structure (DUF3862)/Prokaryotic membrane lipoprotein lipid attachment site
MMKRFILLITLMTLLAACSKLTQENYDKLKMGMGYDEVVSNLGKPDSCTDTLVAKSCVWGSDRKNITIGFIGNKIMVYSSNNIK